MPMASLYSFSTSTIPVNMGNRDMARTATRTSETPITCLVPMLLGGVNLLWYLGLGDAGRGFAIGCGLFTGVIGFRTGLGSLVLGTGAGSFAAGAEGYGLGAAGLGVLSVTTGTGGMVFSGIGSGTEGARGILSSFFSSGNAAGSAGLGGMCGFATLCISFWETGFALGPISTGSFWPCWARSFLESASASSRVRPT